MQIDPLVGLIVDAAIVITACEAMALLAYGWRYRRPDLRWQVLNVAAGLFLMVGMRAALAATSWFVVAACLAAAGVAHAIDLHARLRGLSG